MLLASQSVSKVLKNKAKVAVGDINKPVLIKILIV